MKSPALLQQLTTPFLQGIKDNRELWLFVFKAMLSLYLATGLAILLQLPSPMTSMLTVVVVMNSQSGMVMAKSFYRILGTIMGTVASVTLVAMFAQQPQILITAIALWSGMCAAGALMFRGFRGYIFVLGGYTVAMITLPVLNNPHAIFDVAIHRFFEVVLGLGVTTLVFDGLFPRQLRGQVKKQVEANISNLLAELRHTLSQGQHSKHALAIHRDTSTDAMNFEDLLANAKFEGPWLSSLSRPLRLSNYYYLEAITHLQTLQRLKQRLADSAPSYLATISQLTEPLVDIVESDSGKERILHRLHLYSAQLQTNHGKAQGLNGNTSDELAAAVILIEKITKSLTLCLRAFLVARKRRHSEIAGLAKVRFSGVFDPAIAWLTFVRTFLVTEVVGLLWVNSHWQAGAIAVFIVVALSMMLAPLPNPLAAVKMAAVGHSIGPFLALSCFVMLPTFTTYPMFVIGTAPYLMGMFYIAALPGGIGLAIPLLMGFLVVLNIGPVVSLDYTRFFNEMLAAIFGVFMACVSFLLMPKIAGTKAQYQRYLSMLWESVRIAGLHNERGLAQKVRSRNSDITVQMSQHFAAKPEVLERFLAAALMVNELCYLIIALRNDLKHSALSVQYQAAVKELLTLINGLYVEGKCSQTYIMAIQARVSDLLNEPYEYQSMGAVRQHLYLLGSVAKEPLSMAEYSYQGVVTCR
ncbi:FUSC family protein [Alteromonas sp. ZYF713]|nr:FUSC family protein [Alteromonas sp. ZYF713]